MKTTLVVMAAGIGSRFGGGIKQLEPVGPNGEIIMDYSIYDAIKAGFDKVVFIIRKDIYDDFKRIIGDRIEKVIDVEYTFQELSDIPKEFSVPKDRKKPWGTGQAVLTVADKVDTPFIVINADDYYGREGFKAIHDYMIKNFNSKTDIYEYCMAGFILKNTLSENGGVTRGICSIDENQNLIEVNETFEIAYDGDILKGIDEKGKEVCLLPEQYVSMNMWGLTPDFLKELKAGFSDFLSELEPTDIKSEYLLPRVIDKLIKSKKAKVKLLETNDKWFGVTYKEDKADVVKAISELIDKGVYPRRLF